MDLLWESFIGGSNSMGIVSEKNILALDKLGNNVYIYPWNCSNYFIKSYFDFNNRQDKDSYKFGQESINEMESRTVELYRKTVNELTISKINQIPSIIFTGVTHLNNIECRKTKIKIGYFFYDYTYLSYHAVRYINAVLDYVFVVSNFVKKNFENSGVKIPISVWHHGIDPLYFHYYERPLNRKKYTFLFVGVAQKRKGVDELLEAFTNEFKKNESVQLIIKSADWGILDEYKKNILMKI